LARERRQPALAVVLEEEGQVLLEGEGQDWREAEEV
jgi:hypothetical protein